MAEAVWFAIVKSPTEPQGNPNLFYDIVPPNLERNVLFRQRLDVLPHWDRLKDMSLEAITALYRSGHLNDPPIVETTIEIIEFVDQNYDEYLLQFFEYGHLPERLQPISQEFRRMAYWVVEHLPDNLQRSTCLYRLLEAKDCAVRARISR